MSDVTLAVWLLEQIAADEAVARAAIGKRVDISAIWSDAEVTQHLDRWSSARVLADCEAKKRIVAYLQATDEVRADTDIVRERVLQFLALPYADRPGYRDEWKP